MKKFEQEVKKRISELKEGEINVVPVDWKGVVFSNYCVECPFRQERAIVIYQGNSLCAKHFLDARSKTKK